MDTSGRPTSQIRITRCSRSARCIRSGRPRRCSTNRLRNAVLSSGLSIILPMTLRTILTLILAVFAGACQGQTATDDTILEMAQAFAKNNKARLAQLLPAARGHVLEPWAAYWELRV